MKRTAQCLECKSLQRKYNLAVSQIYAVVNGRFNNPTAKVLELRRCQDLRDDAISAWIEHSTSHRGAKKASRAEAKKSSGADHDEKAA